MSEQMIAQHSSLFGNSPNALLRPVFKTPILLWRLGLQPIVGRMCVLISHTGRKSGLLRRTVTEYHMLDGKMFVPCAFGEKAQWFKNIKTDPRVTLQSSRGIEHAIARRVTDNSELLAIYYHMKASYDPQLFVYYLHSMGVQDMPENFLAKKDRIYFIMFDPTDKQTPPPLEADLTWVWLFILPILVGSVVKRVAAQR